MSQTLAAQAPPAQNQQLAAPIQVQPENDLVREACARLYAQGYKRYQIAKLLLDHISPNSKHRHSKNELDYQRRVRTAKFKLARWEKQQEFRDMIWHLAVVKTDLATPQIMDGMVKRAIKGNVLAARLALEVTGRHNPKGDVAPTQVAVVFNGLPRPGRVDNGQQIVVAQAVEASDEPDE